MKLSETLRHLLDEHYDQPLVLGTLLQKTGEQGFGIILGLLTLPMVIPLPVPLAGFSTVMGGGVALMGLQLAMGAQQPYLPKCLARRALPPKVSQILLKNLNRVLRPIERLAKRRLVAISLHPVHRRFLGLCLIWDAFLMGLPLPIPLTNIIPGYAILVIAIGLLETDGVLILLGYGLTGLTTAFFISIAGVIWELLRHFIRSMGCTCFLNRLII